MESDGKEMPSNAAHWPSLEDCKRGDEMKKLAMAAAVVATALVAAVPAGAVGPSGTSVSISSTATQTTPLTIVVGVSVTCATFVGNPGFGQVAVSQTQTGAFGFGSFTATCDGKAHKYAVLVTSEIPWALGYANAQAFVCGFVCATANRQIRITAP